MRALRFKRAWFYAPQRVIESSKAHKDGRGKWPPPAGHQVADPVKAR